MVCLCAAKNPEPLPVMATKMGEGKECVGEIIFAVAVSFSRGKSQKSGVK
jgi:hypothetical protein